MIEAALRDGCNARQIANVIRQSAGSIKGSIGAINRAGLSQKDAISALQGVVSSEGQSMNILKGTDGAVVAIGGEAQVVIGGTSRTAAVNIASDGTSMFGVATIRTSTQGTELVNTVLKFEPIK